VLLPGNKKKLSNFNIQLYALVHSRKDVLHLARAARRFVREENNLKKYGTTKPFSFKMCRKQRAQAQGGVNET
jgi:hypothetical protein